MRKRQRSFHSGWTAEILQDLTRDAHIFEAITLLTQAIANYSLLEKARQLLLQELKIHDPSLSSNLSSKSQPYTC